VPGDHFVWKGWRFEVVDMDGQRIDKLLVSREPTSDSHPDEFLMAKHGGRQRAP